MTNQIKTNMKQFFILALIPLILSIGVTPAISFAEIDSPRKQMENGIVAEDVVCKFGLSLMIRSSGNAACVKSTSVKELTTKGFGTLQKEASTPKDTQGTTQTSTDSCSADKLMIQDIKQMPKVVLTHKMHYKKYLMVQQF